MTTLSAIDQRSCSLGRFSFRNSSSRRGSAKSSPSPSKKEFRKQQNDETRPLNFHPKTLQSKNKKCLKLDTSCKTLDILGCLNSKTISFQDLEKVIYKVLIIDTRSFLCYTKCHIMNSINICVENKIVKKKFKQGNVKVEDIISTPNVRQRYENNCNLEIVLYDESSRVRNETSEAFNLLMSALETEGRKVLLLDGGIKEFKNNKKELCVEKCGNPILSPTTPPEEQNVDIELAPVAEILPYLFIGNERDASSKCTLESLGITHVLNCTSHLPEHFSSCGIIYQRLPANDSSQQDLKQYFEEAFEFIEKARMAGGKVLVHCQAGVSRSATITISYILRKTTLNAYDAYKFVKSKRDVVSPNLNFMGQLMTFEEALNKGEIERQQTPSIRIQ